ncbi:MAG: hypothetical protein QW733_03945 [Desulfurococcaceae archaeon]
MIKKAYISKDGNVLVEAEGSYFEVSPPFKLKVEDKRIIKEDRLEEVEEVVKEISKEEFEEKRTDYSIVYIDGLRGYEDFKDLVIDNMYTEIEERVGDMWEEGKPLEDMKRDISSDAIVSMATSGALLSHADYLETEYAGVSAVYSGNGIEGYRWHFGFGDKLSAEEILEKETVEYLQSLVDEIIEEKYKELASRNFYRPGM